MGYRDFLEPLHPARVNSGKKQDGARCMNYPRQMMALNHTELQAQREEEFTDKHTPFLSANSAKRGFCMTQAAFNSLPEAAKKKLMRGLD